MKLVVKDVDERQIKRLAHEYLSGYYVTLKNLGTKYQTTGTTISNILWRGIAENIIDLKVARCVYNKVVDKPSKGWYQRKLRWDEAFARRENFIREQERRFKKEQELETLYSLKEYYESAIAGYGNFFIDNDEGPSLEELEAKLDEVIKKIDYLS